VAVLLSVRAADAVPGQRTGRVYAVSYFSAPQGLLAGTWRLFIAFTNEVRPVVLDCTCSLIRVTVSSQ